MQAELNPIIVWYMPEVKAINCLLTSLQLNLIMPFYAYRLETIRYGWNVPVSRDLLDIWEHLQMTGMFF